MLLITNGHYLPHLHELRRDRVEEPRLDDVLIRRHSLEAGVRVDPTILLPGPPDAPNLEDVAGLVDDLHAAALGNCRDDSRRTVGVTPELDTLLGNDAEVQRPGHEHRVPQHLLPCDRAVRERRVAA